MNRIATVLGAIFLLAFGITAEKPESEPGYKGPARMADHMLQMMDANKDGKISKDEWQAHHDQRFSEIDADKDGAITPTEMKEHHRKMREKAEICAECPRSKKAMRKGRRNKTAAGEEE